MMLNNTQKQLILECLLAVADTLEPTNDLELSETGVYTNYTNFNFIAEKETPDALNQIIELITQDLKA
jgi:hypothetical protein